MCVWRVYVGGGEDETPVGGEGREGEGSFIRGPGKDIGHAESTP